MTIVATARADEKATEAANLIPSTVSLFLSGDGNSGRSSQLSAQFYLPQNIHVDISGGNSRVNETSENSETERQKTSSQFSLGAGSDPTAYFSAGARYEYWGLRDALQSDMFKLPVAFNIKPWRLQVALTAGHGRIDLPDVVLRHRTYEAEIEDSMWAASLTYSTPIKWSFGLRYEAHDYNKNITSLNSVAADFIFSNQTLSLASSLINHRESAEVTRAFKNFDLTLDFFSSESAFDESVNTGFSVAIDYFVDENWSLYGSIGSSRTDDGLVTLSREQKESVTFVSLGATYSFDLF